MLRGIVLVCWFGGRVKKKYYPGGRPMRARIYLILGQNLTCSFIRSVTRVAYGTFSRRKDINHSSTVNRNHSLIINIFSPLFTQHTKMVWITNDDKVTRKQLSSIFLFNFSNVICVLRRFLFYKYYPRVCLSFIPRSNFVFYPVRSDRNLRQRSTESLSSIFVILYYVHARRKSCLCPVVLCPSCLCHSQIYFRRGRHTLANLRYGKVFSVV